MTQNGNCQAKGANTNATRVWAGVRGYLLAACCVGIALLGRFGMDPLWGDKLVYVFFFLAVFVVAHFADTGPVLFTMVTGFLLGDWFFVARRHTLYIASVADRMNAVFFFLMGFLVLFLSRRTRVALARERAAHADLREHAEALRESEARYSSVVQNSNDAIVGNSLDGTIIAWNPAAEKLYGYGVAEAVGKSIDMLLPPERGDEMKQLLARVGQGEKVKPFETTRRASGNRLVEVSLSISPIHDSGGRIVGATTIERDVTERREAEREKERLFNDLQAALAEVKTLTGLLPICAHCKKIRDDQGYWNQMEKYIMEHSEANFTHSICPECSREHYPTLHLDCLAQIEKRGGAC